MAEDINQKRVPAVAYKDDLASDLLTILNEAGVTDKKQQTAIMAPLVSYIVRRDHKVFNHAYGVGRSSV